MSANSLCDTGIYDCTYPNINLHLAVIRNNKERIQSLINAGENVNVVDKNDNTPLHIASAKNKLEVAMLLVGVGANVNAANKYGEPPLHFASSTEIANLLIAAGANLNAVDNYQNTALSIAYEYDRKDIVMLLINAGANLHFHMIIESHKSLLYSACRAFPRHEFFKRLSNEQVQLYEEMIKLMVNAGSEITPRICMFSPHRISDYIRSVETSAIEREIAFCNNRIQNNTLQFRAWTIATNQCDISILPKWLRQQNPIPAYIVQTMQLLRPRKKENMCIIL